MFSCAVGLVLLGTYWYPSTTPRMEVTTTTAANNLDDDERARRHHHQFFVWSVMGDASFVLLASMGTEKPCVECGTCTTPRFKLLCAAVRCCCDGFFRRHRAQIPRGGGRCERAGGVASRAQCFSCADARFAGGRRRHRRWRCVWERCPSFSKDPIAQRATVFFTRLMQHLRGRPAGAAWGVL